METRILQSNHPLQPLSPNARCETNVFINPMWQNEVQRIGKQRCTPSGYQLHVVSDLIGFVGIILLFAIPINLIYSAFVGTFTWSSLWLMVIPFIVAIIGNILHSYSWHLAHVREFKYDHELRVSTWRNGTGTIETFSYEDWRKNSTTT